MKVKDFLRMGEGEESIEIFKVYGETKPFKVESIYKGDITDYFKQKKPQNGTIKSWYNDVENWDYSIMHIEIE